eukprot:2106716-Rhodomonas_salina.1
MSTTHSGVHSWKCRFVSHTSHRSESTSTLPPSRQPVSFSDCATHRAAPSPSSRHPARRMVPSARTWPLTLRSEPGGDMTTMTLSPKDVSLSARKPASWNALLSLRMSVVCRVLHVRSLPLAWNLASLKRMWGIPESSTLAILSMIA